MRIIGIDPGYAIVGYAVLDYDKSRFSVVNYGAITTSAGTSFDRRLFEIHSDMCSLLDMFKPDCMSIERLYFNSNKTTGIDVAQARGVILLSAVQRNIEVYEYTPLQVKQSVVGYGRAEKHQVQVMVQNILNLPAPIKPDDTADAAALAICHGHSSGSALSRLIAQQEKNTMGRIIHKEDKR